MEMELYKVLHTRSLLYRSQASRATARAAREGVQASNPPVSSQAWRQGKQAKDCG